MVIIAISNVLTAQKWAPVGATWQYYSENDAGNQFFYKVSIESDTVVANQPCRKYNFISQIPDTDSTVFLYEGFTFERNDSVFVWEPAVSGFTLKYAFSAQVGDTIAIPVFDYSFELLDTFRVVLESRDIVATGLNQVPLERYQVRPISGLFGYWRATYYRGVGSLHIWNGHQQASIMVGTSIETLRCYEGGGLLLFVTQTEAPCARPSAVSTLLSAGDFRISPNPSGGVFYISSSLAEPAILSFYTASGQLIDRKQLLQSTANYEWTPPTMQNALYFYLLTNPAGQILKEGKLIVTTR